MPKFLLATIMRAQLNSSNENSANAGAACARISAPPHTHAHKTAIDQGRDREHTLQISS